MGRCAKGPNHVETHCPATCKTCDECRNAIKPFMTLDKGLQLCNSIGNGLTCEDIGDEHTCRKACGTCSFGPPCLDSTRPFLVNEIERTCEWVAGAPETKCERGKAASHCPVTCGTCSPLCQNSGATFLVKNLDEFRTCKWVGEKNTEFRCAIIGEDAGYPTCPEFCG